MCRECRMWVGLNKSEIDALLAWHDPPQKVAHARIWKWLTGITAFVGLWICRVAAQQYLTPRLDVLFGTEESQESDRQLRVRSGGQSEPLAFAMRRSRDLFDANPHGHILWAELFVENFMHMVHHFKDINETQREQACLVHFALRIGSLPNF